MPHDYQIHTVYQCLTERGAGHEVAEGFVEAMELFHRYNSDTYATKADLRELEMRLTVKLGLIIVSCMAVATMILGLIISLK